MILASAGWAAWWIALVLAKVAPGGAQAWLWGAAVLSAMFGLLGLLIAALTVRARRTWLLFVLVPLFANGSLFLMPWLARGVFRDAG